MNAAYALMVRTYAGIPGSNLLQAIENADESFGIEKPEEVKAVEVAAKNQQSIATLNAEMGKLQRRR